LKELFDEPEAPEDEGVSEDFTALQFDRVNRLPKLSADEQEKLLKRWTKFRDEKARDKIIAANLRIVPPMAGKTAIKFGFEPPANSPKEAWTGFHELVSDLTAEGNLHLVHAVDHYKKGPFLHYARKVVKNGIVRYARELKSNVHRPYGKPILSDRYLALVNDSEPGRIAVRQPPTHNVQEEWAALLRTMLDWDLLTKQESRVIRARISGLTLEVIGKELDVSTATAWRIEKRAINKLGLPHGINHC
jgi:RNA polymerase sigma factor (sigma-70 family)